MATTVISGLDGNDCEFLGEKMCLNSLTGKFEVLEQTCCIQSWGWSKPGSYPSAISLDIVGTWQGCTCFHPEKLEFLALSVWFSLFDKGTGISLSRNKQRLLDEVSVVKKGCRLLFLEMYFCDSRFWNVLCQFMKYKMDRRKAFSPSMSDGKFAH